MNFWKPDLKNKWSRGEKVFLSATIVLLALLCVKSFLLDPFTPSSELEQMLAAEALEGLRTDGVVRWRVVDIRDVPDPIEGLEYQKVIRLRRYLLYIFPFGHGSVYR